MRYQLHYETKDGKRFYYGEYTSIEDALTFFNLLWKKEQIAKVELIALAKD